MCHISNLTKSNGNVHCSYIRNWHLDVHVMSLIVFLMLTDFILHFVLKKQSCRPVKIKGQESCYFLLFFS